MLSWQAAVWAPIGGWSGAWEYSMGAATARHNDLVVCAPPTRGSTVLQRWVSLAVATGLGRTSCGANGHGNAARWLSSCARHGAQPRAAPRAIARALARRLRSTPGHRLRVVLAHPHNRIGVGEPPARAPTLVCRLCATPCRRRRCMGRAALGTAGRGSRAVPCAACVRACVWGEECRAG